MIKQFGAGIREKKNIILAFVVLAMLLALASYAIRGEDTYNRTFSSDELLLNAGTNHIAADSGYSGMVTSGPVVSLPKGIYRITVNYDTNTNGNYFQLWCANNNAELSLVDWTQNGYFSASHNSLSVQVTFRENISDLEVCTFYGGSGELTINSVNITCVRGGANTRDSIIIPVLVYLFAILWYLVYSHVSGSMKKALVVLSFCAIIANLPCYVPYLVSGHDMPFEVDRVIGLAAGLRSGQFPVRIHPTTFGSYGYAVSVFYPELLLYFPAFLYNLGMSLTGSVQIYLILVSIASAVTMYIAAAGIFNSHKIALYSSVMYELALYRLVLTFIMNGYGSAAAMIFTPLIIYGFYEIMTGNYKKYIYLVIGVSGVLQSHILTLFISVLLLGVATVICLFRVHELRRYLTLIKAAVITLLLNAWFLVPFLQFYFSRINTGSLEGQPSTRALSFSNLFYVWGYYGTGIQVTNEPITGVPAIVDLSILAGLVCLFSCVRRRVEKPMLSKRRWRYYATVAIVCAGGLATFATTKYFPWGYLENLKHVGKLIRCIQHPQRILCIAIPCLCMAAACGYHKYARHSRTMLMLILTVSVLTSTAFLSDYSSQEIKCYKGEIMTSYTDTSEYLYPGTDTTDVIPNDFACSSDNIRVESFGRNGNNIHMKVTSINEGYIDLPIFYYPGYEVTIEGREASVTQGDNNTLRVMFPIGSNMKVHVWYRGFALWRVADWVTVITAVLLVFAQIRQRIQRKRKRIRGRR